MSSPADNPPKGDLSESRTPMDATKSRRVGITVGLFLMLISVAITSTFLVIGGALVFRNAQALFWSKTQGVLIDARIDHRDGKSDSPAVPVVHYRFTADGRQFVSDHWSPAGLGLDVDTKLAELKSSSPLTVYYNPTYPADCAVVLPSLHLGFLPFTLGLGLFFILVLAISGGTLFAAMHPGQASNPASGAQRWIRICLRVGAALTLTSLTGLITMLIHSPGGWWQWAVSAGAVAAALGRSRRLAAPGKPM